MTANPKSAPQSTIQNQPSCLEIFKLKLKAGEDKNIL
jgi:hypothetical protein